MISEKNSNLNSWLPFLFLLFGVTHSLFGVKENLTFLRLSQLLGVMGFILLLVKQRQKNNSNSSFKFNDGKLLLFFPIVGLIINQIYYKEIYLLNLIYPISFYAIANLVIQNNVSIKHIYKINCIVLVLFSLYALQGNHPREWVKGSANHVSVVLITLLSLMYIFTGRKIRDRYLLLGFSFWAFFLCVLAKGRGGIIAASIFVVIGIWQSVENKYLKIILICTIFFATFNYTSANYETILETHFSKFKTKGFGEEGRELINDWYRSRLNVVTTIVGVDTYEVVVLYDQTLHNSVLGTHSQYGILGVCVFIYGVFVVLKNRDDKYIVNVGVLLAVIVRGLTDDVLWSQGILLGLPFTLLILLSVNPSNNKKPLVVQN